MFIATDATTFMCSIYRW